MSISIWWIYTYGIYKMWPEWENSRKKEIHWTGCCCQIWCVVLTSWVSVSRLTSTAGKVSQVSEGLFSTRFEARLRNKLGGTNLQTHTHTQMLLLGCSEKKLQNVDESIMTRCDTTTTTMGAFLVIDTRVFNGPRGRSLGRSFACIAHSAHLFCSAPLCYACFAHLFRSWAHSLHSLTVEILVYVFTL